MDVLAKAKTFSTKFPREIIEDALNAFMQEAKIPNDAEPSYSDHEIEADGESWKLPSKELFLSEYGGSVSRAHLVLSWSSASSTVRFSLDLSKQYNGEYTSSISVTLFSRTAIKAVFCVFQDYYDSALAAAGTSRGRPTPSTYSLNRGLPSASVKPQLIHKLESLLLLTFDNSIGPSRLKVGPPVEICVFDSQGSEQLASMNDYEREYFPDDTRRVIVRLGSSSPDRLEIQFDIQRYLSTLNVAKNSSTARADAKKIADQIMEVIDDYKNGNWILNPPIFLRTLLELTSYGLFGSAIVMLLSSSSFALSFFSLVLAIQLYLGAYRLKPYSEFYTRRNEQASKWFNWFVFSAIEFLLFSVFGATIIAKFLAK